jgi:4-hydroxybenzoate polyprenyltransferase
MPRIFGIAGALRIAQVLHLGMIACLVWLVFALQLGAFAFMGVLAVSGLLVYEHSLVKPTDLSRVDAAFFTMNGWVSVLFFCFWAADIFFLNTSYARHF